MSELVVVLLCVASGFAVYFMARYIRTELRAIRILKEMKKEEEERRREDLFF